MPVYKLTYIYGADDRGWTETYYRECESAVEATNLYFEVGPWLTCRPRATVLEAIRAQEIDGLRRVHLRLIYRRGLAEELPDVTSVSAHFRIPFLGRSYRNLQLRGLTDPQVNLTNYGISRPGPLLVRAAQEITEAMRRLNFCGRRLVQDYPWSVVKSLDLDERTDGLIEVQTLDHFLPIPGSYVYFGSTETPAVDSDRGYLVFDSSPGRFSIIAPWPDNLAKFRPSNMRVRVRAFDYPRLDRLQFVRFSKQSTSVRYLPASWYAVNPSAQPISPCGRIVDFLRASDAYTTTMRFWADDVSLVSKVVWYFPEQTLNVFAGRTSLVQGIGGRQTIPYAHPFASRTWEMDHEYPALLGETYERTWNKGRDNFLLSGRGLSGDKLSWERGATAADGIPRLHPQTRQPCPCGPGITEIAGGGAGGGGAAANLGQVQGGAGGGGLVEVLGQVQGGAGGGGLVEVLVQVQGGAGGGGLVEVETPAVLVEGGAGGSGGAVQLVDVTETFDSSTSWICPAGVNSVYAECWGGGGGQYAASDSVGESGGGGGAYSADTVTVSASTSYTITVGAGGGFNADGGDSWFGTAGTVLAKGGGKAYNIGAVRYGGPGGSAGSGIGAVKYSGGAGGASGLLSGGGGGSSAGTGADGSAGTGGGGSTSPGAGGVAPDGGGDGGAGGARFFPGTTGSAPGGASGGAGGAANSADSAGGRVRLTYSLPLPGKTSFQRGGAGGGGLIEVLGQVQGGAGGGGLVGTPEKFPTVSTCEKWPDVAQYWTIANPETVANGVNCSDCGTWNAEWTLEYTGACEWRYDLPGTYCTGGGGSTAYWAITLDAFWLYLSLFNTGFGGLVSYRILLTEMNPVGVNVLTRHTQAGFFCVGWPDTISITPSEG